MNEKLLDRSTRKERFFLFAYTTTTNLPQDTGFTFLPPKAESVVKTGEVHFAADDFPKKHEVEEMVKSMFGGFDQIVITGWNEFLTKSDFERFTDKGEQRNGN